MKEVIIIPGACSSKSNWFDKLEHFNNLGYKVDFLDLEACMSKDMQTAAECLLVRLERIFVSSNNPKIIYAHSMGGMLLLKIFFQREKFSNFSKEFLEELFSTKIVFIQAPLGAKTLPYVLCVRGRPLILLFVSLYRSLIYFWLDPVLLYLKRTVHKARRHAPLLVVLDVFLNTALMLNSFAGSKAEEVYNLIEYYKEWKNFDFPQFITEDIKHANFKNFYFTCGDPDIFEDREKLEVLVKTLGARIIHMPIGFHNPQHFFWWQGKLLDILHH